MMLMATVLTFAWGCSSSDDDDEGGAADPSSITPTPVSTPPTWEVTFTLPKGSPGKPDWQQVDFYQFENTMTIVLHLEEEMVPYLSEGDLMAAVVDGQVREVASIQFYTSGEDTKQGNLFMLLVPFADSDRFTDLYYYNAKTDQSWLLTTTDLHDDNTLGSERDFVLGLFTVGTLTAKLSEGAPFTPTADDRLALFVDDICCGVGTYDTTSQQWVIKAYKLSSDKSEAHFRYYSAEKRAIYRTGEIIDFTRIHRNILTPYYLEF